MRESIGAVSLLNFVIFFILLIFAFMLGTFSYYKAYRVNNFMVSSIEKYEGFNTLAKEEMEEKMKGLAYEFIDFNCPDRSNMGYRLIKVSDDSGAYASATNADKGYTGYCIYAKEKDISETVNGKEIYDSYQVTTIITFNFPVVQSLLKMRVSSKTNRIYNFECSQKYEKRKIDTSVTIPDYCK